jgi:hypothetical protein
VAPAVLQDCFERLQMVDEGGADLNTMLDGSRMLKFLSVHRLYMDCRDLKTIQPLPSLRTLLIDSNSDGAGPFPNVVWSNLTCLALRLASSNHYRQRNSFRLCHTVPTFKSWSLALSQPRGLTLAYSTPHLRPNRHPPTPISGCSLSFSVTAKVSSL